MATRGRIVVVTGATGRQGGAVVRHLLSDGWRVRSLTHRREDGPHRRLEGRADRRPVRGGDGALAFYWIVETTEERALEIRPTARPGHRPDARRRGRAALPLSARADSVSA
jgi:uncharacterized protein YbjT (DUF2867 family)